ncbi:hypothetical protein UCREL1_2063 [Eutypa lata UCREL1]|uniref:Ecp2 effector protein domain-containing protein n=1 Tax=Eutypa lata (strain UCR-EL1) TaxID=1287681 RepID=M7T2U7_EUTLA|nr:hypothetical protein UCREL1_2063 [Eutypa lata UCREL1]
MRFAILTAITAIFGLAATNPLQMIVEKGNLDSSESFSSIQKRDAFTCYGASNATVSDCQQVIDSIRTHGEETFHLHSGMCLVWHEGGCGVRFCAVRYVQYQLNRTASWIADYLTSPLLDSCIGGGTNGIMADTPNINSNLGSYRLYMAGYTGHD